MIIASRIQCNWFSIAIFGAYSLLCFFWCRAGMDGWASVWDASNSVNDILHPSKGCTSSPEQSVRRAAFPNAAINLCRQKQDITDSDPWTRHEFLGETGPVHYFERFVKICCMHYLLHLITHFSAATSPFYFCQGSELFASSQWVPILFVAHEFRHNSCHSMLRYCPAMPRSVRLRLFMVILGIWVQAGRSHVFSGLYPSLSYTSQPSTWGNPLRSMFLVFWEPLFFMHFHTPLEDWRK